MNTTDTHISIEKRVVDTVLERASEVLTLDGIEYPLAPPTLATIIMTSELAATLPGFTLSDDSDLLHEVLRNAKHCRTLGKITAVLLLGAKRVLENRQVPAGVCRPQKCSFFHRILRSVTGKSENKKTIAEVDKLAQICINELSPSALQAVLTRRLIDMQLADFFALTTSLSTANQIRPTREVDEATVSGE